MTTSVLRVVELARGIAGPVCGRLFAGLGHEVVKCEAPDGDWLRREAPYNAEGTGLGFVALNADKSSVTTTFDRAGFDSTVAGLLAGADVLVLDLLPAEAEAMGLSAERLRESWPDLVVVWVTAFGRDGEFSELAGDSLLAEAYGGLATMIGDGARRPLSLGGEQTAYCGGVAGFLGAMVALTRRDGGAGGDVVDVALCDVAAYMDWKSDVAYDMTGVPPTRSSAAAGEWRMVRARDGWIGVIFQQRHWGAMVELVGDPALADPAFATETGRVERADEWWPIFEAWARTLPAEQIYDRAQRLGLPFGWVVGASDLVHSRQLRERGFIRPIHQAEVGLVPSVGSPANGGGLAWRSGRAPALGAGSSGAGVAGAGGSEAGGSEAGGSAAAPATSPVGKPAGRPAGNAAPRAGGGRAPLDGVVVLDFGTITAGAAATRLLADHGATVLKVEWLDKPDTFRSWKMPYTEEPAATRPLSPYFASNNVGKCDVAINLKTAEGRELVHALAARSHVFVENFRVGVTRRLGIDHASLRAINPDLVYLSLSSQGQDGPESRNSSYGSTLDLLSGLASLTGYEPDRPLWSSSEVNYPDQLVSLLGAAFLAYCVRMGQTGVHLDMSQREVVSWTLDTQVADFLVNGRDSTCQGNVRPGRAPHDTFPSGEPDRWIALSCSSDEERAALAEVVGSPVLRGRDAAWWTGHASEAYEAIGEWTARYDRFEAVRRLRAAGVAAVPVLTAADRATTPRFTEHLVTFPRAGRTTTDGSAVGATPVKGFPMRFREYHPPIPQPAPAIGRDTREVLTNLAGISAEELAGLEERGVIYCHD